MKKSSAVFGACVLIGCFACSSIETPEEAALSEIGSIHQAVEQRLSLTLTGSSVGWPHVAGLTDGNLTNKESATVSASCLQYQLAGPSIITSARIMEDNDGSLHVDTWKIQYDKGAGFVDAVGYTNTPSAMPSWNVVDFPDISGALRVNICMQNNGNLEAAEIEVWGNSMPVLCGNGTLDSGEQCDDGNTSAGDGCGQTCSVEPTGCEQEALPRVFAIASSVENSSKAAEKAIDGNMSTRWSSAFSNPQWISVDLGEERYVNRVVLYWENASSADYDLQASLDGANWTTIYSDHHGNGGTDDVMGLSAPARYVRMYSRSRTTQYGNSLWEVKVYGDLLPNCGGICGNGILESREDCDDGNLAEGDGCSASCYLVPTGCEDGVLTPTVATASSLEGSNWGAAKAIDQDLGTRWSSSFSDPQWLKVDMGSVVFISRVVLHWETAASDDYDIQVSDTGLDGSWITLFTLEDSTDGNRTDTVPRLDGQGRFLRIYSRGRTTQYGNSLWEVEVFGDQEAACAADESVDDEKCQVSDDPLSQAEQFLEADEFRLQLPPVIPQDPNFYY